MSVNTARSGFQRIFVPDLLLVRLLVQAADVLALFKMQCVARIAGADIHIHVFRGILRGAQAQAVEAERILVAAVRVVVILAARIHLAEDKFPVVALLPVVVSPPGCRGRDPPPPRRDPAYRVTVISLPYPSRASSMELDRISNTACSQPSMPSDPKITAGRRRTRSAPLSMEMLSLLYTGFFTAIKSCSPLLQWFCARPHKRRDEKRGK